MKAGIKAVSPWVRVNPGKKIPVGRIKKPMRSVRHPTAKAVRGPISRPPSNSGNPANLVTGPGKLGKREMTKLRATIMAATAILRALERVFIARDFAFARKKPAT
jgi:hypothetical protein